MIHLGGDLVHAARLEKRSENIYYEVTATITLSDITFFYYYYYYHHETEVESSAFTVLEKRKKKIYSKYFRFE